MLSIFGNCSKFSNKNPTIRLISSYFSSSKMSFERNGSVTTFSNYASIPVNLHQAYNSESLAPKSILYPFLIEKRFFSKKKGSKQRVEEEDSDSDEEEYDETANEDDIGDSVITRTVPSLRVDSVLKAGLGVTKKKIEQDFYALKLRRNGEKVVKKAVNVYIGDEIDRVRGFSPDTSKFLLVDRIIIRGIDKITGTGMYPVQMEVLKSLVIGNYEDDPWRPDSVAQLEK